MSSNSIPPVGFDDFARSNTISYWIYRTWTIPFVIVGIIGNVMGVIIFIRWAKHLSIYIYFTALCLINICVIMIDIEYHFLFPYVIQDQVMVHTVLPISCKFIFFFTYFLRYMFIWLITVINIDRCLFLTESKFKSILCCQRSALTVCFVLVLFAIVANIHFPIYFNQPIITRVPSPNACLLSGLLCHCTSSNQNYRQFWKKIWPVYHIVLFAIVPMCIMCISCSIIVRHMRLTRRHVIEDGQRCNSDTSVDLHSVERTLIYLDLLFPLTIFPTLIFQTYVNYSPPSTCHSIGVANVVFAIGFASTFIKNVFSFLIFWFTGRKFRQTAVALLRCRNS